MFILEHKSSGECKKVVSDILGEIKFVVDIESTSKMAHFELWGMVQDSTQKCLHFYGQNKMSNNEN